jgi:hypothetical protein
MTKKKQFKPSLIVEKTISVIANGKNYNLSLVNGKAKMVRWSE